jgi:hypothetical protein
LIIGRRKGVSNYSQSAFEQYETKVNDGRCCRYMRCIGNREVIVLNPIKYTGNDMRSFRYDKGSCFLYE